MYEYQHARFLAIACLLTQDAARGKDFVEITNSSAGDTRTRYVSFPWAGFRSEGFYYTNILAVKTPGFPVKRLP
jgi:hypothetical protein